MASYLAQPPRRGRAADPRPESDSRGERVAASPICLYLEVTNRCNLECKTCIRTYRTLEPPADLTADGVRRILSQMDGPERAVLQGIGEPLMNAEIFEVIALLKARGARVVFNTNATLLDSDRRRRIIDSGMDELRISLDAATAATFERVRAAPPRVFERILEGTRVLAAEVRASGRAQPALSLWIIGVHENVHDLVALVRLAHEMGVPEVYLHRLVFQGEPTHFGIAREDESIFAGVESRFDAIVAEAARVAGELGIAFKGSGAAAPAEVFAARSHLGSKPWSACRRPWTLMYVTANGNVLPCCIAPFATTDYPAIVLGNLFERPLAEIWNGERYRSFRVRLLTAEPPECCRGCGVKWSL